MFSIILLYLLILFFRMVIFSIIFPVFFVYAQRAVKVVLSLIVESTGDRRIRSDEKKFDMRLAFFFVKKNFLLLVVLLSILVAVVAALFSCTSSVFVFDNSAVIVSLYPSTNIRLISISEYHIEYRSRLFNTYRKLSI